jgi:DNA-directed RNA polymerase II subunit RPB1
MQKIVFKFIIFTNYKMDTQSIKTAIEGTRRRVGQRPRVSGRIDSQVTPKPHIPLTNPNPDCPVDRVALDRNVVVDKRERQKIMSQATEQIEQLPSLFIEGLAFTLFSTEEIRRMSSVSITSTDPYGEQSVNDPQMGSTDDNTTCFTCNRDNFSCPGHFGHIDLNVPIIHPLFYREVISILNSVCNSCGNLLISKNVIEERGINRLNFAERLYAIEEASKSGLACEGSQSLGDNVAVCKKNPTFITTETKESGKIVYTLDKKPSKNSDKYVMKVEDVEKIFDNISDDDAKLLGFNIGNHPRNLIMKALIVIPPCARPPIEIDGILMPDHLTSIYIDIIKFNNLLKIKQKEDDRVRTIDSLVARIGNLIDNSDGLYKAGKQQPIAGIKQLIQGKEALIRSMMLGKRVNYSGRTVAAPGPYLKFGQVGVPQEMASSLTKPVTATSYNIASLRELLKRGQVKYITSVDGKFKGILRAVDVSNADKIEINIGDKVDRYLQNGDYVLVNRQPTLHKQGIMGREVVLHQNRTIDVHLYDTKPMNLDFDGDEVNIHIPQTLEAEAEIATIANIKECVMSGQANRPILGGVIDTITGCFLLTKDQQPVIIKKGYIDIDGVRREIPISEVEKYPNSYEIEEQLYGEDGKPIMEEFKIKPNIFYDCINIITQKEQLATLNDRLEKYGVPKFSGRALFSSLLPKDFYYEKRGKLGKSDNSVIIHNGILIQGIINSSHVGASDNSIIQTMWREYGVQRTTDFLTDLPFVINKWLANRGFTIGIADCFPTDDTHKKELAERIEMMKLEVKALGGQLDDPVEEEKREKKIKAILDNIKALGDKIATDKLSPDNNLSAMALSGAKGSTANIAQITGFIGQQFFKGKRVVKQLSGGTRVLPYFEQNDEEIEARGFVSHSYLDGLTPAEFLFLHIAGREGLMDTALKTADVGFIQRKLTINLRDIVIKGDGSARNDRDTIYQYVYGTDGFEGQELQSVSSTTGGDMASFINLKQVAGKLNVQYGFDEYAK